MRISHFASRHCSCVPVVALALAVGAVSSRGRLPAQAARGAFITMVGTDTVAVEQFTRTGNILTGDYVTRLGGTTVNHYVLRFDVNNRPSRLDLTQQRANGQPIPGAPKSVTFTAGDKESVIVIQRDTAITRKFSVVQPYPLLGTSLGMFEVAFIKLRSLKADSVTFAGLPLNSPVLPDPIQVKFFGADSARVWSAQGPLLVRVDATGHIIGMNGATSQGTLKALRTPPIDLQKLLLGFAAADAAGKGLPPQ